MRLAVLEGIINPMILRPYWLGRVHPPGTDLESSDTVANASQLIAKYGFPHRTANRFSVPIAPYDFFNCATGSSEPALPKARHEIGRTSPADLMAGPVVRLS